jgi:CCR4-NOT transcriptional complex subunit CAF120
MSSFSNRDSQRSPTSMSNPPMGPPQTRLEPPRQDANRQRPSTPPAAQQQWTTESRDSPQARLGRERAPGDRVSSRPMSMVQTYQPPLMELTQDTLPELQPIFSYLNSHGNKLYQEGYFLKLDDQNSRMKDLVCIVFLKLTYLRWQAECRSNVDGMLCAACWNNSLPMGRCGT